MGDSKSDGSCANRPSDSSVIPEERESTTFVQNISYNFFDIATAAGKFAKNPNSKTALDNFFDKLKGLEKEWYEFGVRYEEIYNRNETLAIECQREKHKSKVYQKRLRYVKENQENFERLREVYRNIKSLEERSLMAREVQTDSDSVIVNRRAIDSAKDTLNSIKQIVTNRETRYEENNKKMEMLKGRVEVLESLNNELTQMLRSKVLDDGKTKHIGVIVDTAGEKNLENRNTLEVPRQAINLTEILKYKPRMNTSNSFSPARIDRDSVGDIEGPLMAIQSIRSSLTSTIGKVDNSRSIEPSTDWTTSQRKSKQMNRGDCREIEVLKKIKSEVDKKQASIKDKIDRFNELLKK